VLIDGNRPAEQIADDVWRIVYRRLDPATASSTIEATA
jgi:hypothetical protein